MKTIKTFVLATSLLVADVTTSFAQEHGHDHPHKAPHSGMVQHAGDYQIEMVRDKGVLTFYLLDAKANTLPTKGVTGKAEFEFSTKAKATSSLTNAGENSFKLDVPKANIFTTCTVSMVVNGKTATAKFKNTSISDADLKHGHQHN